MRVRTPKRLRAVLPGEIVKSFGGVSAAQAKHLGWLYRAEIQQRFRAAEIELGLAEVGPADDGKLPRTLSETELIDAAKRYLSRREAEAIAIPLDEEQQREFRAVLIDEAYGASQGDPTGDAGLVREATAFGNSIGIDLAKVANQHSFIDAIAAAELEHLLRQIARVEGEARVTTNPAFANVDGTAADVASGVTLDQAVALYMEAPERSGNSDSSKKMDRSRLGALREILGASKPVSAITKADLRDYVAQLMKLPKHYTQRYPGLSPRDAIAKGQAEGAPTLSPTGLVRLSSACRTDAQI